MLVIGISFVLLGGCGTTAPSRFYLLSPMPDLDPVLQGAENELSIGIGPVELSKYLDRPQIVTRTSQNRLSVAEFDRWAEPIEDNFTRVLAENLSCLLSTDCITIFPWKGPGELDFRVAVDVARFEAGPGNTVNLSARWTLYGEGGKKPLLMRKSDISKPMPEESGYEAIVYAKSEALAELSREIASSINE